MEDTIKVLVFSDSQLQEFLKYAKSPWITITKMAIIQDTFDLLLCYVDYKGEQHRQIIKNVPSKNQMS